MSNTRYRPEEIIVKLREQTTQLGKRRQLPTKDLQAGCPNVSPQPLSQTIEHHPCRRLKRDKKNADAGCSPVVIEKLGGGVVPVGIVNISSLNGTSFREIVVV
jgi:hypothetical protein